MRRTLLAALFAASLAVATIPAAAAAAAPDPVGDYIVVLKDGTDAASFARNSPAGSRAISVGNVYSHALSGYSAKMTAEAAAALAKDPLVQWVQPDRTISIAAQTLPTGVNRVDTDLSPTARINNVDGPGERVDVDVAVIDTGIQYTHPDLNVYTAGAKNCNDGTSANDLNGHGTHVAGIIGATDNTIGVVGVAPGARLWPVRVLNAAGSGSWSQVICGVDYVTAHASEIEVANMSIGGSGGDDGNCGVTIGDALHRAICAAVRAGVTISVAAGNSASNAAGFVPASYDEVITVSALADYNGLPGGGGTGCSSAPDDTRSPTSNFGADVDLIAPGLCIYSTWINSSYNTLSGTSMASAHVAGGAALWKATHPVATPASVRTSLQAAAVPVSGIPEKLLNVATF
ncbi:S8 family serine peptidase [Sphaerisporangium sp. NPDC051011]|uniref:S8 family serine peptidase n=1 Tax=Sphaerisporangium sp. NPDC051011 TaxID=3155792 RepID=UPI0033DCAA05